MQFIFALGVFVQVLNVVDCRTSGHCQSIFEIGQIFLILKNVNIAKHDLLNAKIQHTGIYDLHY
jgi:hypothetical protein